MAPTSPATRQENADNERKLLAQWWDVHNRGDLLDLLAKLQSGDLGQRGSYWELRKRLVEGRTENYIKVISEAEALNKDGDRAFFVATHLASFNGRTLPIAAWDFGRYINLCRWGVIANFLTEKEAWDRILPAARLLQASFSSWDDFAVDYMNGRNFWNSQTGAENESMRYTIALLKSPPSGLWSTLPWGESLGNGAVLKDSLAARLLDHYADPDPNGVALDHSPEENPLTIFVKTSADPQ